MAALDADGELLQRAISVTCQKIHLPECDKAGIEVLLRRDDLIDELAVGNKYYKLYFNVRHAKARGKRLLTMGGPWSNHLLATALVAKHQGLACKAFVRGLHHKYLSETLSKCQSLGMELEFVDHQTYRQYSVHGAPHANASDWFVGEGGSNELGVYGASFIGQAIRTCPDVPASVCLAVGSGGTFAGVVKGLQGKCQTIGVPVLKHSAESVRLKALQGISALPWRLLWGFHLGGYGRRLPSVALDFWRKFEIENRIPLDPVYTLKLLWAVDRLAQMGYWSRGQSIIAIHTGGLQGRQGFAQQIDWRMPS